MQFTGERTGSQSALMNTDTQREELQAIYPAAQALAVDICDTVEFFYRADKSDSSRRQKCSRWGVVYLYDAGETPAVVVPGNGSDGAAGEASSET